jgi:hypothetical protein
MSEIWPLGIESNVPLRIATDILEERLDLQGMMEFGG